MTPPLSTSSARLPGTWRMPLLLLATFIAFLLWAYRDTAAAMVTIWIRSETFNHAFLVPPIALWLIWRRRAELAPLVPQASAWVALPMAGMALVWWLGQLAHVAAAMQLMLVTLVVASVPLLLGWQVTKAIAFPLAFMFFSVPIGDFMTPTLMHWTVEVLVAGLRLTGIPVHQEGQQLVIPSGRWAVIDACSGVRYLMATFMAGSLFAYLNYQTLRKRLIFVAISLVLPVVANWLRAYIIVMLGHLSNNEIATGVDHLVYGWVFFGIVVIALFWVGAKYADPEPAAALATSGSSPGLNTRQVGPSPATPWLAMGLAVAAVLWPLWQLQAQRAGQSTAPVQLALPDRMGAWQWDVGNAVDWAPDFPGATKSQARTYSGPHGQVMLHLSYYRNLTEDAKLVSSSNRLLRPKDDLWIIAGQGLSEPVGAASQRWRSTRMVRSESLLGAARGQLTIWQIYWVAGRLTESDIEAKLRQAWAAALGQPDDSAVLHLVSTRQDDAGAAQALKAFVVENSDMIVRTLEQARDAR